MGDKEIKRKSDPVSPINVKRLGTKKTVKLAHTIHSKTTIVDELQSKPSCELNGIKQTSLTGADEKVKPETKVPHTKGVHYGGIYEIKGHGTYLAESPKQALKLAGLDSGNCTRLGDGVGKFGPYDNSTKDYQPEQYNGD